MLIGFRGIIVAFGLVLVCANHAHAKSGDQQSTTQEAIAESLQDIATAKRQEAERAERADKDESPCGEGQYGSNSDLCAQWKAADSAANSAWWAWVASVSTIISTAAVVVAIGLTYQSNLIARDTARRQLRAYIVFDGLKANAHSGHGGGIRYAVLLRNVGQTPSQKVLHKFSTMLAPSDVPDDFAFADLCTDPPESVVLGVGGPFEAAGPIVTTDMHEHLKATGEVFLLWGWIEYEDIFRRKWRTEYSVKIMSTGAGPQDTLGYKQGSRFNNLDEACMYWPPKS
jgi:hypothetical protein